MPSAFPHLNQSTLGIISGTVAHRLPGGVMLNHSNARTFRELARHAKRTVLGITLLSEKRAGMNEFLAWPDADLVALPPMSSTVAAQRYAIAARKTVRKVAAQSDVLFVRMPFQVPWAVRHLRRPAVFHFAGDIFEVLRQSPDYRGFKRFAALAFARLAEWSHRRLLREPNVFMASNGQALIEKYGVPADRAEAVVSSCLSATEMDALAIRPLPDVPRLLFVGYLRPEKGVDVLLDAFDRIRATRPATLTLAGGADRLTQAERQIHTRIAQSPFSSDIHTLGHVEFGPPLFDLYRTHDALILPSRSEGTPRVLIEARAFNCPVIATTVGGIPTSVTSDHDGLLVPPDDATALAAAIARLLDDAELRRQLIEHGHQRALVTALETFTARLATLLERALTFRSP